jgi:sulfur-carrier protein
VTDIRVVLPVHLRTLARTGKEVTVSVPGSAGEGVTQRAVLDALELAYPVLRGTIRDRQTGKRRAFVRFYACEQDLSNEPPDAPLPWAVAAALAAGTEPFLVVGAMAGG